MRGTSRRSFLSQTAMAAAGFSAWAFGADTPLYKVRVKQGDDPVMARTFSILKDRIETRTRLQVVEARRGADLVLDVDPELPPDGFRIDTVGSAVRIAGGSACGVLYGAGKFLRTCVYGEAFQPSAWRGRSVPEGSIRGMYFAAHFHNWYHQASREEIARYMEDLALWGVNAVKAIFPMINLRDWNDPEAAPAIERLRQYATSAHELGMQFATGFTNAMFRGVPDAIRATPLPDPTHRRGNHGFPVCPSTPEGHAYIVENTRPLFERLSDVGLDVLMFWPYDEGGCACAQCSPWGSNGFLKMSQELAAMGREYFPDLKIILSTWMFDTPPEGEWQGLSDALASGDPWVNYILADAHEDFPRYPLDVQVPGGLPLLNFPEISMWGNSPWGGYGAHPLPGRYQRLWDQVKQTVRGGFPYSEGIYEDINKAIVVQFYWDRNRSARETVLEYVNYEYGPGLGDDVLGLIDSLEAAASASYRKEPVDKDRVLEAARIADAVDARLADWARTNWRWEILHLRALIDRERFAGGGLETPAAEAAMMRLIEIYHCELETDDPYHHRVRPPLKGAVSRNGTA